MFLRLPTYVMYFFELKVFVASATRRFISVFCLFSYVDAVVSIQTSNMDMLES